MNLYLLYMKQNEHKTGRSLRSWRTQYEDLKKTLDKFAYKIYQNTEDADFQEEMDLKPVFARANVHYNTFIQNHGYNKLAMYNGVENVENKKKIRFNPEKWLKHRRLGKSNKYYIEELYE